MKFFKIASIFTLSIFTLLLVSCENEPLDSDFNIGDGENPFNSSNNLIGTWTMEEFDMSVTSTTEVGGIPIESMTFIESENENYDLVFNASTFTTSGSYGYIVDITVNGQSNTQNLSVQNVSGNGNYTTNGNELTSDASFVSFEFQGTDLSEFQGEQTAPYTISADGQTLTFTQSTTETTSEGGSTTTSVVNSTSIWTKVNSSNDPCAEASDFTNAAESAYNNDNTNTDLCNAYKSALQNQITACGDANGELQTTIDGLGDCENNNQPNAVEISLTTGTLPIEFDQVTVVTVGNTLQVTGETSAQNNYMVYFEVEEGATGMEIINSTFVLTLSTTDPDYFPSTQGFDDYSSNITENGVGTLVGTFGGVVTNSSGADLSVTSGVINIMY